MFQINVQVTNLAGVSTMVDEMNRRLNSSDLVEGCATIVQDQAKRNAMSGHGRHEGGYPNVITGLMSHSINYQLTGVHTAVVGCGAYYAKFVEFGHKQTPGRFVPIYDAKRITRGESKGKYMVTSGLGFRLKKDFAPAYPFMRPAIKQSIKKIEAWVKRYLRGVK
jgi:HK97 gp10 family phage protein